MSPTTRASPAMSRADSIHQIASTVRCVSPPIASSPSHALHLEDLANLVGPGVKGRALEPLQRLVHRPHLPQPVACHELFGLRERAVDDRALPALEPKALALRARVEPAIPDHHPRLDQLFVELLKLRHLLWRRGCRRPALMVFLRQYQHTHVHLLLWD